MRLPNLFGSRTPAAPQLQEKAARRTSANAADPRQVVALCAEAKVPQLAQALLTRGLSLPKVKERIENARAVRDAFAAAGFPKLADTAIAGDMDVNLTRSLLIEATAAASEQEVSHHQPTGEAPPAPTFNALNVYRRGR